MDLEYNSVLNFAFDFALNFDFVVASHLALAFCLMIERPEVESESGMGKLRNKIARVKGNLE